MTNESTSQLPAWAAEMRQQFRTGSASQFVLSGNVFDLVTAPAESGELRFVSLRCFLTEVMLAPFDVIVHYDRGRGIRVRKGGAHFHGFLKAFDAFHGTSWASVPDLGSEPASALDLGNLLPRDARRALELINRFVRGSQHRTRSGEDGARVPDPLKVAVILDYAHFIAPAARPSVSLATSART